MKGGDTKENVDIALHILKGEDGPKRDIVLLNAGAAIVVGELASSLEEGITLAEESLDSGAALDKLERLKSATNSAGLKR